MAQYYRTFDPVHRCAAPPRALLRPAAAAATAEAAEAGGFRLRCTVPGDVRKGPGSRHAVLGRLQEQQLITVAQTVPEPDSPLGRVWCARPEGERRSRDLRVGAS